MSLETPHILPLHGGDLIAAEARYGIPRAQWLDLSTGMNPRPYPVFGLPDDAFQQLPYLLPELVGAAAQYYGQSDGIPLSGSQACIEVLPQLLPDLPVLVPEIGYQEHRQHWLRAGRVVVDYPSQDHQTMLTCIDQALAQNPHQHLLVINPNNPSGLCIAPEQLQQWARQSRGYLVIDEAFMDVMPGGSVLGDYFEPNMVVLRSFGKFFGLAGIRMGFAFAEASMLAAIDEKLSLWRVNGPAQHIAIQALKDIAWQQTALQRIQTDHDVTLALVSEAMALLVDARLTTDTPLFFGYTMNQTSALKVHECLARCGVLVRFVELPDGEGMLRFGLMCGDDTDGQKKLASALKTAVSAVNGA